MFNPKPRPPILAAKTSNMAKPASSSMRPGTGSTISGLHKTAIFNASKSNLSNAANSNAGDFKTPAAKVRSPAPIKMAEKVVSSPMLPEILSEDDGEQYLQKATSRPGRPDWAVTP